MDITFNTFTDVLSCASSHTRCFGSVCVREINGKSLREQRKVSAVRNDNVLS